MTDTEIMRKALSALISAQQAAHKQIEANTRLEEVCWNALEGLQSLLDGPTQTIQSTSKIDIELLAKTIHDTWHDKDGYVSWENFDISDMQDLARSLARKSNQDEQ